MTADKIDVEPARWLIPNWLPLGHLTLVNSDGRAGKSSLLYEVAARLSRGDPCLGLEYPDPPKAGTVVFGTEDSLSSRAKPFLIGADADLPAVSFYQETTDAEGKAVSLALDDVDAIRAAVQKSGARLVVIDPATAFLPSDIDDHKEPEVRAVLGALAKLAAEEGVAVVLVKHTGKGEGRASNKFLGSVAWRNVCRASWLVLTDPDPDAEGSGCCSTPATRWRSRRGRHRRRGRQVRLHQAPTADDQSPPESDRVATESPRVRRPVVRGVRRPPRIAHRGRRGRPRGRRRPRHRGRRPVLRSSLTRTRGGSQDWQDWQDWRGTSPSGLTTTTGGPDNPARREPRASNKGLHHELRQLPPRAARDDYGRQGRGPAPTAGPPQAPRGRCLSLDVSRDHGRGRPRGPSRTRPRRGPLADDGRSGSPIPSGVMPG